MWRRNPFRRLLSKGQAVSDGLNNPKILAGLLAAALTLEILLGQGDAGDAFFQGFLDMLRRMGLW